MTVDQKHLVEPSHFSTNPCGYSFGIIAELQSAILEAKKRRRSIRVNVSGVGILVYPGDNINSLLKVWEELHEKKKK